MFKNHFLIALRNLSRQKLYSLINILGLAVGLACTILIYLWVNDELSYDKFNEDGENIYRVVENQFYAGGEIFPVAVTPGPLAKTLNDNYPEIESSLRVKYNERNLRYKDNIQNERVLLADSNFFNFYSYPLIKGDENKVLKDYYSIVLGEETALKYFGNEDPVGKQMQLDDFNVIVTGIMKTVPSNSHLQFDIVVPFELLRIEGNYLNWGTNSYYTYVKTIKNAGISILNEKIKNVIKENNEGSSIEIYLQPLYDIHLYSGNKFAADIQGNGDIVQVNTFSIIALFVLLIACINFMNLSTARSTKRAREVGMRKVVGAYRHQIIRQFFIESIVTAFISLFFSILIVYLTLPFFNDLSGKEILFNEINVNMFLIFFVLALVTGIFSGVYPALYLSSFKPVKVLKNTDGASKGGAIFRKTLVILQYSLSIILIISTITVYNQLEYMQNKKLGINKENIVYFRISSDIQNKKETLKTEMLKNPGVLSLAVSTEVPTHYGSSTSDFDWDGKNQDNEVLFHFTGVDEDYPETFGVEITYGRFFEKNRLSDTSGIIINEAALKIIGYDDPVGKRLNMWGDDFTIIGVTKDFHFKKLNKKIEPLVMRKFKDWDDNTMFAKISGSNIQHTLKFMENTFNEFAPEDPFEYIFLEESFDNLYKAEMRLGRLFTSFSVLAIMISCLGLFGLASFMAEKRTKEIGVRKVLGATITNLTMLLSKEFTKWVILSNIVAWPVAWYFMNQWLQDFAYRIEFPLWIMPLSGLAALGIAVLTVSFQTVKASLSNPIKAIKYE
ncbi:MAG: ABC transporter permease [Ignavibacteria bacterium]